MFIAEKTMANVDEFEALQAFDGMSVSDSRNMPHPTTLTRWSDEGLYEIDAEAGVFRVLKVRLTVQVFKGAEVIGEYIARVPGINEQSAVDYFMQFARKDLQFKFLGRYGFIKPSAKQVHVTDRDGKLIANRLYDDGSDVLNFESGFGFIAKSSVAINSWTVNEGWPPCRS